MNRKLKELWNNFITNIIVILLSCVIGIIMYMVMQKFVQHKTIIFSWTITSVIWIIKTILWVPLMVSWYVFADKVYWEIKENNIFSALWSILLCILCTFGVIKISQELDKLFI